MLTFPALKVSTTDLSATIDSSSSATGSHSVGNVLVKTRTGWRWPWRSRPAAHEGRARLRTGTGGGIEFAGHHPYAQGEDLRHVDWALYGRTGRLFTKVREHDAGHRVSLLFDSSSSMETGDGGKGRLARELAAALAQTFVLAGDTCRVIEFAEGLHRKGNWVCRRSELPVLAKFLERPHESRRTDWTRSMRELQTLDASSGPLVILSDFWGSEEMAVSLRNLTASGREILALQILASSEANPQPRQLVCWRDAETGEEVTLRADATLCEEYRLALGRRRELLASIISPRGGVLLTFTDEVSSAQAISQIASAQGNFSRF